jgi:hypothetical protein
MAEKQAKGKITDTGFEFGSVHVQRLCTLPKEGVAIRLSTKNAGFTITATKGGKVRIRDKNGWVAVFAAPTAHKAHK